MTAVFLAILVGWIAILGAAFGSFFNVVIWRVPEGMSLISPPSHCPKCGARVRPFDNVPILAWLWLRGRCRDCKAPISVRYPFVEFLCCAVAALYGASILTGGWVGFASQTLNWAEFADYSNAWEAAVAAFEADPTQTTTLTFDGYWAAAQKAIALAFVWAFAAYAALILGFVEWDKGAAPKSLVLFAASIPVVGLLTIIALGDADVLVGRCGVFAASVGSGVAATLLFWRAISRRERAETAALGALWGFCAGYWGAFLGCVVLFGVAAAIRRKTGRNVFGLLVFSAIVALAVGESVWFAAR
ncbi:MAG: prepilin peptidase [Thermoguttaceae bacterium]|nr:prepilin peptidase [Thermoguttaceae bacterium]